MNILKGSCHCGAIEFEVQTNAGLEDIRHCNCSFCKRRSAYVATATLDQLTVTKGAENLTVYAWNTGTAKHYFCKTCGIYTHHQRRSNPNQYGYNIACIEGVDPFSFGQIPVYNGQDHISDGGADGIVEYGS